MADNKTTVSILGTEYTVEVRQYDEDEYFKARSVDGYCTAETHEIILCDLSTFPGLEKEELQTIEAAQKHTFRHEIVHAFFNEIGLQDSAGQYDTAWSKNEEMVDWIAIQGPKIYAAWQSAGAV